MNREINIVALRSHERTHEREKVDERKLGACGVSWSESYRIE